MQCGMQSINSYAMFGQCNQQTSNSLCFTQQLYMKLNISLGHLVVMWSVDGPEYVLEDVKYYNHTCPNCPCYKCMVMKWVHFPHECVCCLDLKNSWGVDFVIRKERMFCKCWFSFPYVPSSSYYYMAPRPCPIHRQRDLPTT